MIRTLLWKESSKLQISGAIIGTIIGLILMLLSFQLFLDISNILSGTRYLLDKEYITLTKEITLLTTSGVTDTYFTEEEIKEIGKQSFVNEITPYVFNTFEARMYTDLQGTNNRYYTELFFESLPDKYLAIDKDKWQWSDEDDVVPIIIPSEYLALYNFGFAPGRGLPQISKASMELLSFTLVVTGKRNRKVMQAKIAGLSERLNTILVPMSFMEWANENFTTDMESVPKKLLVVSDDASNPDLLTFLEKNQYVTNTQKLKSSRIRTLFNLTFSAISIVGVLIVVLSLMVFVVSLQLIITRSSEKIKLLIHLGYPYTYLVKKYSSIVLGILTIVFLFTGIVLFFSKGFISDFFVQKGFAISSSIDWYVVYAGIGLYFFLLLINVFNIYKHIKKLA